MGEFDPDAYLAAPQQQQAFDPDAYLKTPARAPVGGFNERQRAYREALRNDSTEPQPELQRTGAELAGKWGQFGKGLAKGVPSGLSGGFLGDIEEMGRHGINKFAEGEVVSPHTAIPTSTEGGYLGPRGAGVLAPAANEDEALGIGLTSQILPGKIIGKGLGAVNSLRKGRPEIVVHPSRGGLRNVDAEPAVEVVDPMTGKAPTTPLREYPEYPPSLEDRSPPAPPPPPAPAATPREGSLGLVMPPNVPHTLPMRAGVGADAAAGPLSNLTPKALDHLRAEAREAFTTHTAEDAIESASSHQTLAELAPSLMVRLQQLAIHGGDSRNLIHDTLRTRAGEAKDRMRTLFDENFGEAENMKRLQAARKREQSKAADPLYAEFRSKQVWPTQQLADIIPRLEAAGAFSEAKHLAGVKGVPWTEDFATMYHQGRSPTAEAWDLAKQGLDAAIEASFKDGMPTKRTRAYTELKRELINSLENHPDKEIGRVYREAREAFAGPAAITTAEKMGRKFHSMDVDDIAELAESYSTAERAGYLRGVAKELKNALGNPGNTELLTMRKMMSDNTQEKLRAMIGDAETTALVRGLEYEYAMHFVPDRVLRGSDTALRMMDNPYSAGSGVAAEVVGTGLQLARHPRATTVKLGAKFATEKMLAKREAKAQAFRNEIAPILLSQGPERNAILRYLVADPPRARGGRIIKRADGGRTPKVDYQATNFPTTTKHEVNASYPLTNNVDLTGRAHTFSSNPLSEKPQDWGASIGLRKNFEDGGAPDDPAVEAEAARNSAARRISRSVRRDDAVFEEPRPTPEVIKNIGSDYSEGVANQRTGAAAMGNQGLDNMKSGNPAKMALGVGQSVLSPVLGMTAPIGGAMNTITKGVGRVGPGLEHAAEVATLLNPDTPLLKAAPMLAGVVPFAGKTTKAAAKAAVTETGENLVNLGARREEKQVEGFHKELMGEVGERAQERMKVGAEYHESGKLPMPVGTRFTTSHSRERELLPWEVTGHYVDPKNPEKFGYYAQRGEPGQEGYERSTVLVNDPKRPEIAKLAEQFTPMGGPIAVQEFTKPVRELGNEGRQANEVATEGASEASVRGPGGDFGVAEAQRAAEAARGSRVPLEGLPQSPLTIKTPGGDIVYVPGPIDRVQSAAEDYMRETGLKYQPITSYRDVAVPRAKRIAEQFEKMKHDPTDPAVKASYDAMIDETVAQWRAIEKTGVKIEFIKPDMVDPYAASPRMAIIDVRDNNHLWVYPTEAGFGTADSKGAAEAIKNNPLLRDTGIEIDGHKLVANDLFRIVHDFFGHIKDGNGFRAGGEENAWRSHSRMYSKLARPAMTSETRGQNSWLNYGPHGDKNRTAKSADTIYADQKIGLMPSWTHTEGAQDYYVAPKTESGARLINAGVDAPPSKSAQTVADPYRMMYPGVYGNPRRIAQEAAERVAPEDINMKRLWGVTRGDLDEMAKGRKGNRDPDVHQGPGHARGALSAQNIQTPQNTQRIQDILVEAGKHRGLKHADAWYIFDPVYQHMVKLFGPEEAKVRFERLNTLMGMASPASEVLTEIQRGTAANMKAEQGRFDEFLKYAGAPREWRKGPEDLRTVEAHPYHSTAQAGPMQKYLETGKIQSKQPKVPLYVQASGVPETGFQTRAAVPDSHHSRDIGLADTRKGPTDVASSASISEHHTMQPWWENEVAGPLGLESVPAQARLWTALGPRTGVTSQLGQGKLELLTKQIMKAARRLGITPEQARDLILSGKAHAGMLAGTLGVGAAGAANQGVGNGD